MTRCMGTQDKSAPERFRLEIREHVLAASVIEHWTRLPREVVDVSWLSVFKRYLKMLSRIFFKFWLALNILDSMIFGGHF